MGNFKDAKSKRHGLSRRTFMQSMAALAGGSALTSAKAYAAPLFSTTFWKQKLSGNMFAWGAGTRGQLGNGNTSNMSSPVTIGSDKTWSQVAAGDSYSMAVKTDGTLWAWGLNTDGQLGNGSTANLSSPVQIGSDTNWVKVGCGSSTAAALKSDGTLWTWGANNFGMVGRGWSPSTSNSSDWSKIAAGLSHSLAIKTDGTLWAWGLNLQGQLGIGSTSPQHRLSPNQIGTATTWIKIAAGDSFSVALKSDNTLWTFGGSSKGELGDGTITGKSVPVQVGGAEWSNITAGKDFVLATKTDGTLWAWGNNLNGALGQGTMNTGSTSSPVQVGSANTWTHLAAGDLHGLARKSDGTIWSWGTNDFGQLGTAYPARVGTNTWSKISSGTSFNLAIKSDGTLWAWGVGTSGALAQGNQTTFSSPVQIGTENTWTDVAAGSLGGAAIRGGALYTWGDSSSGRLGDGTFINKSSPVQVGTLTDWVSVTSNQAFANAAIKSDGTLWVWGSNTNYMLGDGTATSKSSPVQIAGTWSKVAVGGHHMIAVKSDNSLWAWGTNTNGVLGDNSITTRSLPVQIGTLTTWAKVFATTSSSSFAIKNDGTLWAWGFNSNFNLGQGNQSNTYSSPVQIAGNYSEVAGHVSYTMAIKSDNSLWGWGIQNLSQIGTGNYTTYSTPTQIGTDTNWSAISAGTFQALALKSTGALYSTGRQTHLIPTQVGTATDWASIAAGAKCSAGVKTTGTLWTWGSASQGQIGNGNPAFDRPAPDQIGTSTLWSKVAIGAFQMNAIRTDGSAWGWGGNGNGEVGDSTTTQRNTPVQISGITTAADVACGSNFGFVIMSDGSYKSWGAMNAGQQGVLYNSPVQLGSGTNWSNIFINAHGFHGAAMKSDGTAWAWGNNSLGQIGDNTSGGHKSSPVQIGTATDWAMLAPGQFQSGGIKTDGTLWMWGRGTSGELGTGSTGGKFSPVQIGLMTNWADLSCGFTFTVAVKTDGTLWSWGSSGSWLGEVTTARSSPIQVGTSTNWAKVNAGMSNVIAIRTDGTLWTWGVASNGINGDGTNTTRSSPVQIGTATDWASIGGANTHMIAAKTPTS